jgi:hypothetical protein
MGSDDGALALSTIQRLGLLAAERADGVEKDPPEESLRFGIWEPEVAPDGAVEFVRNPAYIDQWRFWADVDRIKPKRGPRVVLLGESVARGYLYDPEITPARILEAMLQGVPGLERAEVVDLARTDLGVDELRTMLDLLPAIEPDAVVLFAGNNWHNLRLIVEHVQILADSLRSGGYAGLRRVLIEQVILARVSRMLEGLAASLEPFGIPVVVIVPEFNLRDWRGERKVLVPVLANGANVAWMKTRAEAQQAYEEGRFEELEASARAMIALDEGTSSVSQNLLAEALLALGRLDEARTALEAARDAVFGLMISHSPRCPSEVQDLLRKKSAHLGFAVVDLPAVLAARGVLADRRLLLDYCHLTVEGMRVTMAATAEAVGNLVGLAPPPVQDLEGAEVAVAPQVESLAHLLAAMHNAHWGQGREVVRYHCQRAVELSAEGASMLLAYADSQSRRGDQWLTQAFEELTAAPNVRRYLGVNESWLVEKLADFDLVDCMVDALESAGTPARDRIAAILADEHGRTPRVDLLDPRYHATTFREQAGYALCQERAYHRALDLSSRFLLVRREPEAMMFKLTCRLPTGRGEVRVAVNGTPLAAFEAGSRWCTEMIEVAADQLCSGVNRIDIDWPLFPPSDRMLEEDARRIERGLYPEVLPAFGEIHAFTATRMAGGAAEGSESPS